MAFFSRKLNKHQLNWTPREKETYAVVEALKKWAGWVGLQPVVVTTDHKSLEDWVHEKVDTPSGPAGRRARWHEVLSKFDLSVQYVPGKDNVVADAMSRFAYPACKTFQDVSTHGSEEARREAEKNYGRRTCGSAHSGAHLSQAWGRAWQARSDPGRGYGGPMGYPARLKGFCCHKSARGACKKPEPCSVSLRAEGT